MPDFKILAPKDPSAKLDYIFDWAPQKNNRDLSDWLLVGETISSYTITVASGLTHISDSLIDSNTAVVVWLSGGVDLTDYTVSCKIVTSMAREDSRSVTIPVKVR